MTEVRRQLLEKLRRVFAIGVDRPLKAAGYRKQAFRYSRTIADGLLHLVEVERGRFPAPDETEFTAICGAYLTLVWSVYPDSFDIGKPRESCCLVRSRIGFLGPERLDTWWSIKVKDSEATLERMAHDLHRRFDDQVLPWLSKFDSAKAIGDYLVAPEKAPGRIRYPYREIVQGAHDLRNAAIAYFAGGDYTRAREILDLAAKTVGVATSQKATAELRARLEQLIAEPREERAKP